MAEENKKSKSTVPPKAFISYSWDSPEYKEWVRVLSNRLRDQGIDIIIDAYELHPGDDLTQFIEQAIKLCDRVLIFCTPNYKLKAESRSGGVGYETAIITGKIFSDSSEKGKFVPVLTDGSRLESVPDFLLNLVSVDLLKNSNFEPGFEDIVRSLHNTPRFHKPPLGKNSYAVQKIDVHKEMARYPGGESAMLEDLYSHIKYPEFERENHIQGTVIIGLTVEKDGSISNIKTEQGVPRGRGLSVAAERAVAKLRPFIPARMNGFPVSVRMNVPIKFTLR